jgi:hypothetical protein
VLTKRGIAPTFVTLTAWEVISWIAFGDLRQHPEGSDGLDFAWRWGDPPAAATLDALEARAAAAPYCVWQPRIRDCRPWDGRSYDDEVSSPRGPGILRRIARRAHKRKCRAVTFVQLAATLRAELDEDQRSKQLVGDARRELLAALRTGAVTVWARPDARRAASQAPHEAVPASLFLDETIVVTYGGTIGPDPETSLAFVDWRGLRYTDARFYTAEVMKNWPVRTPGEADGPHLGSEQPGTPISDHTGAPGRPTSRHLVEIEFKRRVASGEALTTLTHEADALSDWLIQTYPKMAQMAPGTIANSIRGRHRTWKSTK